MMRPVHTLRYTAWLLLLAAPGLADDPPAPPEPVRVGPGVTPPKLTFKVEPEYSAEGLAAGLQGTVVVEAVISEAGRAVNLIVVSPLGFGLDEKAQEAIEKWRFEPGRKAGMPVPIVATIEVNFRLTGQSYNAKDEQFRTRFNLALTGLKEKDEARRRKSAKAMEELAKQDFAPALYAFGKLLETGDLVPRDPERAGSLIRKSADKKFGPALYEVGLAYTQGNQVPKDTEKGLHLIRDAANYGSAPAQYYLANRYERGIEESPDPDRARRYFTLCAASGVAECQVRLAKLSLAFPTARIANTSKASPGFSSPPRKPSPRPKS